MAKKKNDEYWYFRLQEKEIFDADVQQIKNVPGIGYIIFVIYIELCARSIKNGGYFRVNRTSSENGYAADLARLINEDATNTGHALSYLSNAGFIEIVEEDYVVTLHVPIVDNNTGKSSLEADRIRAYERQKKIEENKKLLLEEKNERWQKCNTYGCFNNVLLLPEEYEGLKKYCKDRDSIIDIISIDHAANGSSGVNDYIECLNYAKESNKLSDDGVNEISSQKLDDKKYID